MDLSNDFNRSVKELISRTQLQKDILKPLFFRTINPQEESALFSLILEKPYIQVFDTIINQLEDLIKSLNPSRIFTTDALNDAVLQHLKGADVSKYGVWVYYPWMEKIVHILDEKEYILVRTNRNKHKVTQKEQDLLYQKKIGVIGLSVGQSVSLTLAIERGCGELRIADYDVLDLTNLNRIRSGAHNIDIKKTVVVAREIAEIDPYLKVTCFHEGINDENIDAFFNEKLDLLIDECDSFDIKISARRKAKALGIPVLMEGSDRCTIDIERFDLEPERPVLHGFVDHVDMEIYKKLKSMDDKIPYMAPVTGIETLSPRMKASAIEIMSTISTWPQLSSAVTYGGGITADISRKILLNQLSVSGRFFIDIDDLITDEPQPPKQSKKKTGDFLSLSEIETFIGINFSEWNPEGVILSEKSVKNLIFAANKAPSGGNNQPWRWHYQNKTLHLFLEKNNTGSYLDPDFISSYISLGSAIENLLIRAAADALSVSWKFTPNLLPDHIALFNFDKDYFPREKDEKLARQIDDRHTNRKAGLGHPADSTELEYLKQTAEEIEGVHLTWLLDHELKKSLGNISGQTDLLRMFIPDAHKDFITKEMRWSQEDIEQSQDGIGINTLDLSNNNQIGLRLIKDERAVKFLKTIDGGNIFKRLATSQFQSSAAVGLITCSEINALSYLKGGMAAEKLWLHAADLGYQIHPINVPLIFFYKQNFEINNGFSKGELTQINSLHRQFKEIFNIKSNLAEVFLFRLFKAEKSEHRTIRKSIIKTLSFGNQQTYY